MPTNKGTTFKAFLDTMKSNRRKAGGENSALRRKMRNAGRSENADLVKENRASELHRRESMNRTIKAESVYRSTSDRASEVKKHAKNMRRLEKTVPENQRSSMRAQAKQDALYSKLSSAKNKTEPGKILQRVAKVGKSVMRSPVSPAAVAADIGMSYYKAGQTKSAKKIKSLNKFKKGV